MSIKRTFTVYKLVRTANGVAKEMSFSRQAQADQYKAILEHYGVDAAELEIVREKRTVEL